MSKLVSIHFFQHPNETFIIRNLLEMENIPFFLKDEAMTQTMPFYTFATGGVELQVREEDAQRAVEILRAGGFAGQEVDIPPAEDRLDEYAKRLPVVKNFNRRSRILIALIIIIVMILALVL